MQSAAHDDVCLRDLRSRVERADRECVRRPARRRDVAVRGARRAFVAGGGHDDEVERPRSGDRERLGPVGEARVRLFQRHERDARSIVRVAVAVRVDCAVEPDDELVGARVRVDHANWEDRRARRHPRDHARHLGAVCVGGRGGDVDLRQKAPLQQRQRRVDARVEHGDGDTAAVDAGGGERAAGRLDRRPLVRDRRRIRRPNRVDAGDIRIPLDDRHDARWDDGGESVEHAQEPLVGMNEHALQRQAREEQLLRGKDDLRPCLLARDVGGAAERRDVVRQ